MSIWIKVNNIDLERDDWTVSPEGQGWVRYRNNMLVKLCGDGCGWMARTHRAGVRLCALCAADFDANEGLEPECGNCGTGSGENCRPGCTAGMSDAEYAAYVDANEDDQDEIFPPNAGSSE